MKVTIEQHSPTTAVIKFEGRLDLASAAECKKQLAEAVERGYHRLVVDMGEVPYVDSSGLGALISGVKSARIAGGDLRLAAPQEQARIALELTTLDRIMTPYETVEEALADY